MRQHELAFNADAPGQWVARFGIYHFRIKHIECNKMKVIGMFTLSGKIAEHVGNAVIGIARLETPGTFQSCAEAIVVQSRLAAKKPEL